MKAHFVTFFSPGTFVAESTEQPIASWNVKDAIKMSKKIKERHGAVPYGFRFSTRERRPKDLDSKVIKTSPMYYLGGKVYTLAQIEARNDQKDAILLSNMRANRYKRVVINDNSWHWVQPLNDKDVILQP